MIAATRGITESSPYRGFLPFRYADRRWFFGREPEIRALAAKAVLYRLVLLFGESGAGKSSLLNAGLWPALRREGLQPERLRVRPVEEEPLLVERIEAPDQPSGFLPSIFDRPGQESEIHCSISEFRQRIEQASAGAAVPVLVLDQFEEMFTVVEPKSRALRDRLLATIVELAASPVRKAKFILSMREDFLGHLEVVAKGYPQVFEQRIRLGQLARSAAERAIRGPFEERGYWAADIGEDAAKAILDDFDQGDPDATIHATQLQIVCSGLWQMFAAAGEITADHYRDAGRIQGLLEGFLESELSQLSSEDRTRAYRILGDLITGSGTRDVVSEQRLAAQFGAADWFWSVLKLLEVRRLVNRIPQRGTYYVELASEYLIAAVERFNRETEREAAVRQAANSAAAWEREIARQRELRTFYGLAIHFDESRSGYLGVGAAEPQNGCEQGRSADTRIRFDVRIRIPDLGRFFLSADQTAEVSGTVTFAPLGGAFAIRNGRFKLWSVEPAGGVRQARYDFRFTAADGHTYYLEGSHYLRDDPGTLGVLDDMTGLFTTVHRGEDENAPVYGAGVLRIHLRDAPKFAASMKVEGASSPRQDLAARAAFLSFAYGPEYSAGIAPFYGAQYESLVLAGTVRTGSGVELPFFLVSGTHDRGFPCGDNELFSDVLLALGDRQGGYRRYAITDRILQRLQFDLPGGVYRYEGALFEVDRSTSFTEMRTRERLPARPAVLKISFAARPYDTVPFPFPLAPKQLRNLSPAAGKLLQELLPGERPPGIYITPHSVSVRSGILRVDGREYHVISGMTYGEAERGAIRNLKEPTLLYGYLCAIRPSAKMSRAQILSRTLGQEPEPWTTDRLDTGIGAAIVRVVSGEIVTHNGSVKVQPVERLFRRLGDPILEVNNDHFPTAVFHRRIVEVLDPSGERCLALEADVSTMRLEAIDSLKTVTVASIRGDDKLASLDRVLDETAFDSRVESKLAASGQERGGFLIAVKPNFMFACDKRDRSTYTDPELVHHLVRRLRARGFANIKVVEAQSTYGELFERRGVRQVAEYLGFDGQAGYEVADMTEDATEKMHLGARLGFHLVSRVWRDAGFRISFAKNKTHPSAYYALTLKNIFGALPLANKFKEYHCDRDIYETAIEYLIAFPVDYGLIDACTSADGPFGTFAGSAPSETQTVIGGADLVAVDWVGATKMGLDPAISRYMKLALKTFGKPEIRLVGDASPYRPWFNVPADLALTRHGMDAQHYFGNLVYSAASQMDETHFRRKNTAWHMRLLRRATVPLRRGLLLRIAENPSFANRAASWLLYRMGF